MSSRKELSLDDAMLLLQRLNTESIKVEVSFTLSANIVVSVVGTLVVESTERVRVSTIANDAFIAFEPLESESRWYGGEDRTAFILDPTGKTVLSSMLVFTFPDGATIGVLEIFEE